MNNLLKKVIVITILLLLTKNATIFSVNIPTNFKEFTLDTNLLSPKLQQLAPCAGYAPVSTPPVITGGGMVVIQNVFVQCTPKGGIATEPINAILTILQLPKTTTLKELSSQLPTYLGTYKDPSGDWFVFSAQQ